MTNDVIYVQTSTIEGNIIVKSNGYTRCNGSHKIHLKNIVITGDVLTAETAGKKCECGFHCLPIDQYKELLIEKGF